MLGGMLGSEISDRKCVWGGLGMRGVVQTGVDGTGRAERGPGGGGVGWGEGGVPAVGATPRHWST